MVTLALALRVERVEGGILLVEHGRVVHHGMEDVLGGEEGVSELHQVLVNIGHLGLEG